MHGIQQVAREAGVQVNVGIHAPCPHDQAKIINQALFIGSDGAVSARYDKAHLFDVAIENGPILMESRSTARGDQIGTPVSTSIGQLGMLICFDVCIGTPHYTDGAQLRFPEISLGLRHRGAQLLAYPSAFTERTGAAHWHVLLRARAIETQCYVIAAAQVGAHNEKRRSYGHACVIDPWGSIVAQMPDVMDKNGFCLFDVDLEIVGTVRKHMPLQRRTDLYPAFT